MKLDLKFFSLFALSLALNYFIGGQLFLWLVAILTVMLVIALAEFIYLNLSLTLKALKQEGAIRVGQDSQIGGRLELKGPLAAPRIMSNLASEEEQRLFTLPGNTYRNVEKKVQPKIRGTIQADTLQVVFRDRFGIFGRKVQIPLHQVLVYPALKDFVLPPLLKSQGNQLDFKSTFGLEDLQDPQDLRLYHRGDSLRRVNWKVSAKKGELMVHRGEVKQGGQVMLILDQHHSLLSKDPSGLFENELVTDALACSRALLSKGQAHFFYVNDEAFEPVLIQEHHHLNNLEDRLVHHRGQGQKTLTEFVAKYSHDLGKARQILVFCQGQPETLKMFSSWPTRDAFIDLYVPKGTNEATVLGLTIHPLQGGAYDLV